MIAPEDCKTLDEIRLGMDEIDREAIGLIARRVAYVRAAAKFKKTAADVAAPERVRAVLETRRRWAEAAGLNGEAIQGIYRVLVAYCVEEERLTHERDAR